LQDARRLAEGGADAVIIENFGDTPFRAGAVDAHTVAAMTRIAGAIRRDVGIPIGINVLRNDASAALAVALACDAQFIRVNVHTGVMVTDQGVIAGEADRTMRLRRELGAEHISLFADVLVKHATPLGSPTMADAVEDAIQRGLADAIIVSGSATGKPASLSDVAASVESAGSAPVYVGSGASLETVRSLLPPAHGAIVGTGLKEGGDVHAPVDPHRVREFARLVAQLHD
jgi:membrane complex biogenesis BtpA family protein